MPIPANVIAAEDVAAAAALGYSLHEAEQIPKVAGLDKAVPFVILNGKIEYLDKTLTTPTRKSGTIQYGDAKSFVKAFQDADAAYTGKLEHLNVSVVYGSLEPVKFTAVFNDHGEIAGFRDHRAEYTVKHSKEWNDWMGHNGQAQAFKGNEEFAEFVENHVSDFTQPAGLAMLEIATSFHVENNVLFKKAMRLSDGRIDFQYQEVVDGTASVTTNGALQSIKIPELFKIQIPVFAGIDQPMHELTARFRYRVASGRATIWYDIIEPHKTVEVAFKEIWKAIEEGTKETILFGVA